MNNNSLNEYIKNIFNDLNVYTDINGIIRGYLDNDIYQIQTIIQYIQLPQEIGCRCAGFTEPLFDYKSVIIKSLKLKQTLKTTSKPKKL